MKKMPILFLIFCTVVHAFGQKKTINYQAVIMEQSTTELPGNNIPNQPLINGNVCLKFDVLDGLGKLEYSETQKSKTDDFGLVSLNIGIGGVNFGSGIINSSITPKHKSFDNIIWDASVKLLKVYVSFDDCKSFVLVSSQNLNYVAYALFADAVDYKNVRDAPQNLSNFTNDLGFLNSKDLFGIQSDILEIDSKLALNLANDNRTNKSVQDQFVVVNSSLFSLKSNLDLTNTRITENTNRMNSVATTYELMENKSTSTALGTSNTLYPSQNAVKAYVDGQVMAFGSVPDASKTLKGKILLAGDLGGSSDAPTVPGLSGKENTSNKSTSTTLGTSNTLFPTQNAVKSYVDAQVIASGSVPDASATLKGKILLAGDLGGSSDAPTVPGLSGKENTSNKSTSTALGTSNTLFPTQNAVKSYVDAQVIASGSVPDATSSATGKIQLAGDLGGTATSPSVPGLSLKANLASPTFTGTPTLPAGTIGITQTSGTNTTALATTAFVANAVVSAGATPDATSSATGKIQLAGDLGGTATSPSVPGLSLKANLASPTFTGTISGITATMTGLGNVNNTSDANKQVSTFQQSALDLKENSANKSTVSTLGISDVLFPTQNAVKTYVDARVLSTIIYEVSDEFNAVGGETSFVMSHAKGTNSKIKMFINGVRISKNAYSDLGSTISYNQSFNGNTQIVANDRIQFEYYY